MKNYLNVFGIILIVLLILPDILAQQNIESRLQALENEMSQLRQNKFNILSPENFKKAEEEFNKAKKDFEAQRNIKGIVEKLENTSRYLNNVNEIGKQGEILFKDVLQAREDALVAQAPEFAMDEFDTGEKLFLEASRELEKGDLNDARGGINKTMTAYRRAELIAIKESIVGNVRDLLEQAAGRDVKNNAPLTISQAENLYREVLTILDSDRYAKSNAREIATEASYQASHAMYLADIIEQLKNDNRNWEKLIRDFEKRLDNITSELGFKGHYEKGFSETENDIVLAIRNLKEENKSLKEELNDLRVQNEQLTEKVQTYEKTVVSELQLKKEQEEKFKKVEKMFTRDEAQVLQSGTQIIIRLYALTFQSGSTLITPEHFSLLTKVMRALREFPNNKFMIAGHTDSQGNDAYNLNLSEQRAASVRAYLEANMGISPDKFVSIGYGESKPIASNDSPNGRRLNRRIEIIIDMEMPAANE
jgi:OOP family OmpA-OmpF porin